MDLWHILIICLAIWGFFSVTVYNNRLLKEKEDLKEELKKAKEQNETLANQYTILSARTNYIIDRWEASVKNQT